MTTIRSGLAFALAGLALAAGSARAQQAPARASMDTMAARPVARGTVAGALTTAAIRASAPSGGFVVVRVPLPDTLRSTSAAPVAEVPFQVEGSATAQALGARSGSVRVSRESQVTVALRVSRRAGAGLSTVARVIFASPEVLVTVPIEVDVPLARASSASLLATTIAGARGSWTEATLRVSNEGNAPERLEFSFSGPKGWRMEAVTSDERLLIAGGTKDYRVRLWIPREASHGVSATTILVRGSTEAIASLALQVNVSAASGAGGAGPTLTTTMVSAGVFGAPQARGYGVTLHGSLSDSVTVSGRFSYAEPMSSAAPGLFGLGRAGVGTAVPQLSVTSRRLSVQGGLAGSELPELGGLSVSGVGGVARSELRGVRSQAVVLRPVAVQSLSLTGTAPGSMSAGEIGAGSAALNGSVFYASLDDPLSARRLDAAGLRGTWASTNVSRVSAELAWRDVGETHGLGASAGYRLNGVRGSLELRALHAPGGSRGFARAADELAMTASRTLPAGFSVASSAWTQRDANPLTGSLRNRGASLSPAMRIADGRASIGAELRHFDFQTSGLDVSLASVERSAGGFSEASIGSWQLSVRSALGDATRRIRSASGTSTMTGLRHDSRVSLSRSSAVGHFSAQWSEQRMLGSGAFLPRQQLVSARIEGVRPLYWLPVEVEGEILSFRAGNAQSLTTSRAGVSLRLGAIGALAVAAERNPFFSAAGARSSTPTLLTIRFDRAMSLPRISNGATRVVFRDENGNGRRDRSEPGISGVEIACAGMRSISQAKGEFRCAEASASMDPRSVPVGLLAPSSIPRDGDVALRVVQPVRIQLLATTGDSARLTAEDLAKVSVHLRSSAGTRWLARSLGAGAFILDAVPPGTYEVEMDATVLEEPAQLATASPPIVIDGSRETVPLVLRVTPRALRVRTFGPASAPSGNPGSKQLPQGGEK